MRRAHTIRNMGIRRCLLLGLAFLATTSCGAGPPAPAPTPAPTRVATLRMANIGGYSLAYECLGTGSPAVILEAGYTASGIDTYGQTILPAIAATTRVCTYDRAGDGVSNARPNWVRPLTGATQARELHKLLTVIRVPPPYVLVGHSYGGMISREFAAAHPSEVAGMVLVDASSEPEIPVYERLHAGPWEDGTVTPAPNQRIDIDATVRQLQHAPSLGSMPLIVVTAGLLQDRWLRTVPHLEARAQTRVSLLSTDSIHVLDAGVGHFVPALDPQIVVEAVHAVVGAARSDGRLPPCADVFGNHPSAVCLTRGALAHQST